jgi:hypothetical protein
MKVFDLKLGPTQDSYWMVPEALSPVVKPPGYEADYSHLPSAEVTNNCSEASTTSPSMPSWHVEGQISAFRYQS